MPQLNRKSDKAYLGHISEEDLQLLVDQLEEEDRADTDYFVDSGTIEVLEAAGASPSLIGLLRSAVGTSDGIEVQWQR